MKNIWWALCAGIKGISYEEYIELKLKKLKANYNDLPDPANFLSVLLEYYSFKSVKRSLEVLFIIAGISFLLYVVSFYLKVSFISLVSGVWITQAVMFGIGFYLKRKYKP